MSLSFDDIMKKFYDDPKLGIQTEDAPSTSNFRDSFKNLSKAMAKPKDQTARIAHIKAPPSFQKIASLLINSSGDNSPIIQPYLLR
mgnify:CR=1 FL=1